MKLHLLKYATTAIAALMFSSLFSPGVLADEVQCRDEVGPGQVPGEWVIRYDVKPGYGGILDFTFLGFKADGADVPVPYNIDLVPEGAEQWRLLSKDYSVVSRETSANEITNGSPALTPIIQTHVEAPNNSCKIALDGAAWNNPSGEASCAGTDGPQNTPGDWVIQYEAITVPFPTAGDSWPLFKPTLIGFRAEGQQSIATISSSIKNITVYTVPKGDVTVSGDTQTMLNQQIAAARLPRLQTPNGHCTVQLAPYYFSPTSVSGGPKVAIVGDSLTASYVNTLEERQAIATEIAQNYGWAFHVDAVGGRPMSTYDDSRDGAMDEILGILETDPDVLVVALSTNDAIGAGFGWDCFQGIGASLLDTFDCGKYPPAERDALLQNLQNDLVETLVKAHDEGVCVVLVTPQTEPHNIGFEGYQQDSAFIGTQMKNYDIFLSHFGAQIGVMDWAAEVTGTNWRGDDGLHLSVEGKVAHRNLWLSSVRTNCGI